MRVEQENKNQSERGMKHDECEDFYLQGYTTIWSIQSQMIFQKNISPPSSVLRSNPSNKPAWSKQHAKLMPYRFIAWLSLQPWKWTWHLPPKYWMTFNSHTWQHHIPEIKIFHNLTSYMINMIQKQKWWKQRNNGGKYSEIWEFTLRYYSNIKEQKRQAQLNKKHTTYLSQHKNHHCRNKEYKSLMWWNSRKDLTIINRYQMGVENRGRSENQMRYKTAGRWGGSTY
jgi:hypothetical protein